MQFKNIFIHRTNCPNAAREFKAWSFAKDKNDKVFDKVADGGDHVVDAVIYSLESQAKIWFANNYRR